MIDWLPAMHDDTEHTETAMDIHHGHGKSKSRYTEHQVHTVDPAACALP